MASGMTTVLVVGASGSIGRHVVAQALDAGFDTRALVRDPKQAALFPSPRGPASSSVTRPTPPRSARLSTG